MMTGTSDSRNNFQYERVDPYLGYPYYKWKLRYNGYEIRGEADTIRQAFRNAKKALKRYKRMVKHLNG